MANDVAKTKVKLTDRKLQSLEPSAEGHYDIHDTEVPGFGVRVSYKGRLTFTLTARFGASKNPARRALGCYPAMTLAAARAKARLWKNLNGDGKDPAVEEERQRAAELRRRAVTFAAVAEDFITQKVATERKGAEVAQAIRREFIPLWGKLPITDIDDLAVVNAVVAHRHHKYQAHNLLGICRRLFQWAYDQRRYGLQSSPCAVLKATSLLGERKARKRVFSDDEIRAFWKGAGELGYPYGPLLQLLLLTGQREGMWAKATWSEFDLNKRLWTIPAERMKMDAAHIVPLSDDVMNILNELPRFSTGEFLFSTTYGKKPVNGFSRAKERIDAKMPGVPAWVFHDLRRTMRTQLSAIPGISNTVRELVLAHAQTGMHGVYDQYSYLDEKRFALDVWAARLRSIVDPPSANVVPLRA